MGFGRGGGAARAGVGLEDGSSHQRREAAGHVHHAGAGEVDHTAHDVVLVEGGEEARAIPHPVHHNRIDEARDAERVDEVRHELAALSHGARHDSCRRRAEGVLEVPRYPVVCSAIPSACKAGRGVCLRRRKRARARARGAHPLFSEPSQSLCPESAKCDGPAPMNGLVLSSAS